MAHLLEAAVRGVDTATNDPEAFSLHLLAEQVVFGEGDLLMKSTEFSELLPVEQHEHSRGKRMVQARQVLKEVEARVEQFVNPVTIAAKDVGRHTMKLFALSQFDGASKHRRMREFDIGIEKQNVSALGVGCSQIAPDRGHSAGDYADVQPIAEAKHNFARAVG